MSASQPAERSEPQTELGVYLLWVLGLLMPGRKRPVFRVHQTEPQPLESWNDDELDLAIEEGRRQLDRQNAMLDQLRSRAQWLITIGIPTLVAIASTQPTVSKTDDLILELVWVTAVITSAYGILGSVAIMTVQLRYGAIDAALLSHFDTDRKREIAEAYTRTVRPGVETNATLLTLYWQSVRWLLGGGALGLVVWLIAR